MIISKQKPESQTSIYFIFVLGITFISGCGFSESLNESDVVMDNFFKDRIENKHSGAERFYAESFLEKIDKKEWDRIKNLVEKANGALLSYEKISWNINKRSNTNPDESGTFIAYAYKTKYDNGEGTETITVVKNQNNPSFRIISHNYNSEMIQDIINQGIDQVTESDS
jgi:hypothetical protein